EALYEADSDKARALVAQRQAGIGKAGADVSAAGELVKRAVALGQALDQAGVFDQPVPEYLEDLRQVKQLAYQAGAQRGDAAAMHAAIADLQQALAVDARRLAVAGQAREAGAEGIEAIASALDQARGALVAGNLAAA